MKDGIENTKLFFFFFWLGVCIYITYQIKKCVNNKTTCVYIYVWGCLDIHISAATWPPQTKFSSFAPGSYGS